MNPNNSQENSQIRSFKITEQYTDQTIQITKCRTNDIQVAMKSIQQQENKQLQQLIIYKFYVDRSYHIYKENYYQNGLIKKTTNKNAQTQLHGPQEHWFDNGKLQCTCTYENGLIHGLVQVYYNDGYIHQRVEYQKNKKWGIYQQWYQNQNLQYKFTYINDRKHGLQLERYYNGDIKEVSNFKRGLKQGVYQLYYRGEMLQFKHNYISDIQHGVQQEFWESGNQKSIQYYENGVQHGVQTEFWENGNQKSIQYYENGLREGLSLYWDQNGLKSSIYHENDIRHGLYQRWFKNGQLQERYTFKNGLKQGLYERFYSLRKRSIMQYVDNLVQPNSPRLYVDDVQVTTCLICLDDLQDPVLTRCGHIFCKNCLSKAYQVKRYCPECRQFMYMI